MQEWVEIRKFGVVFLGVRGRMLEMSGERLLRFCSVNELMITNTWHPHKDIHKYTWICPGRQLRSLTDYFLVRRETKTRVHDVKVVRGACRNRE